MNDNVADAHAWHIHVPETECVLWITSDLRMDQTSPMPSRWVRFWCKLFFGFRWTKV